VKSLVIIDNFNFIWSIVGPAKTQSVLLVDSNTVLSLPISPQVLETIARRKAKILQPSCSVKHVQFAPRISPQLLREQPSRPSRFYPIKQIFSARISKRNDQNSALGPASFCEFPSII
jgi:hypothetical protein